jgi:hypothetical protein
MVDEVPKNVMTGDGSMCCLSNTVGAMASVDGVALIETARSYSM